MENLIFYVFGFFIKTRVFLFLLLPLSVIGAICNSTYEESRAMVTKKHSIFSGSNVRWMEMVTDSTKQNFWLYGFVQDGGDQTILAKSNSDLTFDWSSGISETPYRGTFTVTPDGENLFFSPIKAGYYIYWINATDGSVLGRMKYTLAAIYNYKLYAHPDSYAVYFELFDTNSMICKWIPGGTSIE
jgi:hypothetical protein